MGIAQLASVARELHGCTINSVNEANCESTTEARQVPVMPSIGRALDGSLVARQVPVMPSIRRALDGSLVARQVPVMPSIRRALDGSLVARQSLWSVHFFLLLVLRKSYQ